MAGEGSKEDRFDEERRRRRHPAERRTSRFSGILLLLAIPHAAFGYALAGLVTGPGLVRTLHFALVPVVLLLAVAMYVSVRRLPWRGPRERLLLSLSALVVLLSSFQMVTGLWMRWALPGAGGLVIVHVGSGILNTLLVALSHVVAILPSIIVSARKEHAEVTGRTR